MGKRSLTADEILLAKKIFKDSIDYLKVYIHDEKYAFFQPGNSGMTPNGEIYVDGSAYSKNYGSSTLSPSLRAFFIHEMVHVWQKQNNVLNPILSAIGNSIRHVFVYDEAYKYLLEKNKDLLDYRMEQQAQIIEDYVRMNTLHISRNLTCIQNKEKEAKIKILFNSVLKNFISNPKYP